MGCRENEKGAFDLMVRSFLKLLSACRENTKGLQIPSPYCEKKRHGNP